MPFHITRFQNTAPSPSISYNSNNPTLYCLTANSSVEIYEKLCVLGNTSTIYFLIMTLEQKDTFFGTTFQFYLRKTKLLS